MRKIEYIFIDSDCATHNRKSGHRAIPNLGYHFVVNPQGHVLNPTGISIPAHIIRGPIYDPDKYNDCSIFIRYCSSIRNELLEQREQSPCSHKLCRVASKIDDSQTWPIDKDATASKVTLQRAALLQLLVDLRQHFPEAKILGVSEIDGRELYCKNIIISDTMNVLRKELSNLL